MITTIEVDISDTRSLSKTITQLQKIRKQLLEQNGCKQLTFAASKYNAEHIIPYLEIMYNTSSEYLLIENPNNEYYVYAHCDPRKPLNITTNLKHLFLASKFGITHEPFYIGKGLKNRAFELSRNDSHRKIRSLIRRENKEVLIAIIDKNLIEADALHKEAALMDILGLKSILSSGLLVNLDEGPSQERYEAYSKLPEWDKIQKILKINKIQYKTPKTVLANKHSNANTGEQAAELNENLKKLQNLYSKYPAASHNFIIDKASI
jgi:hypothetical protein